MGTLTVLDFGFDSLVLLGDCDGFGWNYWDIGADTAETAVVGMLMVVITLVLSVIVRRLNRETAQLT